MNLSEKGRVSANLGTQGSISGPRSDVAHIVRREICPDLLDEEPSFPTSFCLEPFRPVVNFGVEPIFNNQIFTRGFTVYVGFDGPAGNAERTDAIEKVAQALRTSTLIWVSLCRKIESGSPSSDIVWVLATRRKERPP